MNKIELLKKLSLDLDLFAQVKIDGMSLDQPIDRHAGWVFKHIYSKGYLGRKVEINKPSRVHHGIEHVGRAAFYAPVFANFYRKYYDPEALALTESDLHLIQIALLFHDSGRVSEGIDDTDEESGLMLYFYLTELGVDKEKAILLAEAVANKDVKDNDYKVLTECESGFSWVKIKRDPKNIYQKLVHDSDCIDIIRARDKYEAKYLDFMQNIILGEGKIANQDAFDELAFLIIEVRDVINIQGDSRFNLQLPVKMKYQHEQAYNQLLEDIKPARHPILSVLGKGAVLHTPAALAQLKLIDKTPFDKTKGITAENLNAARREGKLFSRSVITPSRLGKKVKTSGIQETYAGVEIRKTARRKGVSTGTKKPNHDAKQGNPYRSTAMGGFTFTNSGFLIVDPALSQINQVSITDFNSGFAKKSKWRSGESEVSDEEKQAQLKVVLNALKSGGVYEPKYKSPHTEVLCTLTNFDAVFYNHDDCMVQQSHQPQATPWHKHAPYLQALYLRQEYAKCFHVNLPIFYYSGYECFIKQEKDYSSQEIINMWGEMLADHIKSQLADHNFAVLNQTSDQLKVACVYSAKANCDDFLPVDRHYSEETKEIISDLALSLQKELGEEYEKNFIKKLETSTDSIFESKMYLFLIANPALSEQFKETIEKNIEQHLSKRTDLDPLYKLITTCDYEYQDRIPLKTIYALAKSCQSKKYVKEILRLARGASDEMLTKMENKETIKFGYAPVSNIRALLGFVSDFDLSEDYQVPIIKEVKALMKVTHWYYVKSGEWWEWVSSLLEFLVKNNHQAILAEIKEDARELLLNHQALFRGDFQPKDPERAGSELKSVLETYLLLSQFCGVTKEEKKSVIMSFLKKFNAQDKNNNCQFNFQNEFDRVHVLNKSGLLADNDVFQQVLFHISDRKMEYKHYQLVYNFEHYFNNLVLLAQAVPAEDLCDTKIEMLNSDFAKRVEKTNLQALIDLLNKQTIHPVIALTEELQTIIVNKCELLLNQIAENKPEELSVSRCAEIAAFFALIDHLEHYEIRHPEFANILALKKTVANQLQSASVKIGKYEVVQPMFAAKACKFKAKEIEEIVSKPLTISNFRPGFWSHPNTVICLPAPKSFAQIILERFAFK